MKPLQILLATLLFALSTTLSYAQEDATSEFFNTISDSIESAFQEAKTAISNQYYKTEIDFITSIQKQDYNKFLQYYDSLSFWEKAKLLMTRWNAKRLNDRIMKASDDSLELLAVEPFNPDPFHKQHTEFLQLREEFIKEYSPFFSPKNLYNQPNPQY